MKETRKAVKFAGATALAVLITTSAFADQRDNRQNLRRNDNRQTATQTNGSYRDQSPGQYRNDQAGAYRNNQRINASGKITSLSRERDGYRVQLDRGRDSYWIPSSRLGNHSRDLRVGISIGIGGIFNGSVINVDAVNWPGNYGYSGGYDQGYLQGVVAGVDYRRDFVTIRDNQSGRLVDVDMRNVRRDTLRRGDYVTLQGQWGRGNVFSAYRIDNIG